MLNQIFPGTTPAGRQSKPDGMRFSAATNLLARTPQQQAWIDQGLKMMDEFLREQTGLSQADSQAQLRDRNQSLFNTLTDDTIDTLPAPQQEKLVAQRDRAIASLALRSREATQMLLGDVSFHPPLGASTTLKQQGIQLIGMPVPNRLAASALMKNDSAFWRHLAAALPAAQMQDLQRLKTGENLVDTSPPSKAGQDGYGMLQTLSTIGMAKHMGVGVSTFLGVNNGLAAKAIQNIGTPEQRAFWLNALAQGMLTFAFGLTGPEAGSDPRSMTTTYKRFRDPATGEMKYKLNGAKKFIGNAAAVKSPDGKKIIHRGADFIVVFAVDEDAINVNGDPAKLSKGPEERSFRAFMVPRTAIEAQENGQYEISHSGGTYHKLGLNEVNNGDWTMNDVAIPECFMLGKSSDEAVWELASQLLTNPKAVEKRVGKQEAGLVAECRNALIDATRPQVDAIRQNDVSQMMAILQARPEARQAVFNSPHMQRLLDKYLNIWGTLNSTLDETRSFVASLGQGTAEAALDTAWNYAQARIVNGRPIVDYPGVRDTLEVLSAEALVGRMLNLETAHKMDQAAWQQAAGKTPVSFRVDSSMAKLFSTELAEEATRAAKNTLGGVGFVKEPFENFGIEKRLRDAQVLTVYEGASNIQRMLIAAYTMGLARLALPGKKALQWLKLKKDEYLGDLRMKDAPLSGDPYKVADAAYASVLADCMITLDKEKTKVRNQGLQQQYQTWDDLSRNRQVGIEAAIKWQGRLFLLADLATNRRLAELAKRQLDYLKDKKAQTGPLTSVEARHEGLLKLFLEKARLTAIAKYTEYASGLRKMLETVPPSAEPPIFNA